MNLNSKSLKLKASSIFLTSSLLASAATSVTLRNFSDATTGLPLVDNNGVVLPIDELSWEVGTFSEAFANTLPSLATNGPEADHALVISEFTSSGSPGTFNFDGLVSRTIETDPTGALGSAGDTDLYVMIKRALGGGEFDVMVLDFDIVFPTQVAGNASTGTLTLEVEDIIFGQDGLVSVNDSGNIPGAFSFSQGIALDSGVIPEPSTTLLAGLVGLGFMVRRRR